MFTYRVLMLLALSECLAFSQGQEPSASDSGSGGLWITVTCTYPNIPTSRPFFYIGHCDVLLTGRNCYTKLVSEGKLLDKSCEAISEHEIACEVSATNTDEICCVSRVDGEPEPPYRSCIPQGTTTSGTTTSTSTTTAQVDNPTLTIGRTLATSIVHGTETSDLITNTVNIAGNDPGSQEGSVSRDPIIGGCIAGALFLVILVVVGVFFCCRRKHRDSHVTLNNVSSSQPPPSGTGHGGNEFPLPSPHFNNDDEVDHASKNVQSDGGSTQESSTTAQSSSSSQQASTTTEQRTTYSLTDSLSLRRRTLRPSEKETGKDSQNFPNGRTRVTDSMHYLAAKSTLPVPQTHQHFANIVEPPVEIDKIKLENTNQEPLHDPAKKLSSKEYPQGLVQPKLSILKKLDSKKDLLHYHMKAIDDGQGSAAEVPPNTNVVQEGMLKISGDIPLGTKENIPDTSNVLQKHMAKLNGEEVDTETPESAHNDVDTTETALLPINGKVTEVDNKSTALPKDNSVLSIKDAFKDAVLFDKKSVLISCTQVFVCLSHSGDGLTVLISICHCFQYVGDEDSYCCVEEVVCVVSLVSARPGSMSWDTVLYCPVVALLWCAVCVLYTLLWFMYVTLLWFMYMLATPLTGRGIAAELVILVQTAHLYNLLQQDHFIL